MFFYGATCHSRVETPYNKINYILSATKNSNPQLKWESKKTNLESRLKRSQVVEFPNNY